MADKLDKWQEFLKNFEEREKELKGKGLTFEEIVKGVKNGSIELHLSHHNDISIKKGKQKDIIIRDLERELKQRKETAKKLPDNPIAYHKAHGINEFGDYVMDFREIYCWDCDGRLMLIMPDKDNVYFITWEDYERIKKEKGKRLGTKKFLGDYQYEYTFKKEDLDELVCPAHQDDFSEKMVAEINIPSGNLLFRNYFNTKEIYEEDERGPGINSLLGRYRLMQDLASKDVGYGQMGNMSVTIFKKDDGTEVIIHKDEIYNYDEETKEETFTEVNYPGFKRMGEISLSVWRWQCADVEVLKKWGEDISYLPSNMKEGEYNEDYMDNILVNVKPGKWVIEHYYDVQPSDEHIYSKLYLKS